MKSRNGRGCRSREGAGAGAGAGAARVWLLGLAWLDRWAALDRVLFIHPGN